MIRTREDLARRARKEEEEEEDKLPPYIARPTQRQRQDSPPRRGVTQQQQQHVTAEAPVAQVRPRGFRFSPPRRAPVAAAATAQPMKKPVEPRGFGREPPAFDPPPPQKAKSASAGAVVGPKQAQQHWKDVHGLKMETILELDKQVRMCRFKPAEALLKRIEYTLVKFMTEQYLSTRDLARALYKGGVKSIWIVSPDGHLGFMQESTYIKGNPQGGVEAAFESLRLPTDDGSAGIEGALALEPEDAELTQSVRRMFSLPAPSQPE